MKSVIGWLLALVLGLGLIFVLAAFFLFGGRYGGMMRGYGMMGPGFGHMFPFGWIGMLLGLVIPVGLLVLLVVGGIWLVTRLAKPGSPANSPIQPLQNVPSRSCPSCGKPVQGDWKACPYCGSSLE